MKKYDTKIEELMRKHFNSLNEKERRTYAAVEAYKLPHGGQEYICELLGCDRKTIIQGQKDLDTLEGARVIGDRVRIEGGGNKETINRIENINEVFLKIIENNTAGDPIKEGLKWTNLTPKEISGLFKEQGINVSPFIVRKLLKKQILQEKSTESENNERG